MTEPLTVEQAAIVSAYTGILIGDFAEMHKYAEEKFCHSLWSHEFASQQLADRLRELSRDDFVALNPSSAAPPLREGRSTGGDADG